MNALPVPQGPAARPGEGQISFSHSGGRDAPGQAERGPQEHRGVSVPGAAVPDLTAPLPSCSLGTFCFPLSPWNSVGAEGGKGNK